MRKSGSSEWEYIPGCDIDEYQIPTNTAADSHHNWHQFLSSKDTLLWNHSDPDSRSIPSSKLQNSTIHNVVRELSIARQKMYASDVLARETKQISGSQRTSYGGDFGVRSLKTVDFGCPMIYNRAIHSPCLQLDGLRYECSMKNNFREQVGFLNGKLSPYSPMCAVPLPESLLLEPGYINRRNERERDRVRSLNEGYDRLKQRLPLRNKEKRISKVDTLRIAIRYIRQLRSILQQADIPETIDPDSNYKQILVDSDGKSEHSLPDLSEPFNTIDEEDSSDREDYKDDDRQDDLEAEL